MLLIIYKVLLRSISSSLSFSCSRMATVMKNKYSTFCVNRYVQSWTTYGIGRVCAKSVMNHYTR